MMAWAYRPAWTSSGRIRWGSNSSVPWRNNWRRRWTSSRRVDRHSSLRFVEEIRVMIARKLSSILIVEDESIVAKDLQETLVNMGYDAFAVASSAEEAIARAAERRPDLVLMDIRIKGQRDGVETAKILREWFEVPVVYLTAHSDDATLKRAVKTEPFGYLVKPVNSAKVHGAIELALYKNATEKSQRERERWFSTVLRSIADGVIAID